MVYHKQHSAVLGMAIKVKNFDEKKQKQNGNWNSTNFILFLWNLFWYTGIQSPHFCQWPWILNLSKWTLLVDIPTWILLTIMGSIDHSSRCKGWLRNSTYQTEALHNKLIPFATFKRQWKWKEWAKSDWECLLQISIYSNLKFKVTSKNVAFDCWYIGTHTKEKPSKF